jgi:hypothetical protein
MAEAEDAAGSIPVVVEEEVKPYRIHVSSQIGADVVAGHSLFRWL